MKGECQKRWPLFVRGSTANSWSWNRDIVDHKHHEDNVWSILIGAQSGANDNLGVSERNRDDEEGDGDDDSHEDKITCQ